jgi:signal transduction histidine kinase
MEPADRKAPRPGERIRMPAFWPRSLAFRAIAFSTVWAVVALVVIATVISALFRQASERGFESLLSAHLFNLVSSVSVTETGFLVGSPNLGDLRFTQPGSGWYWSVEPASDNVRGDLRSFSLTSPVPLVPTDVVPFDPNFQRTYFTDGPGGQLLEVHETEYLLDEKSHIARFRMIGNRSEFEAEIAAFNRQLYTYLGLFGLGMIAINAVAIMLGLAPLARVRRALAEIREGTAQRLDGTFPNEIAPLAEETNALIDSNRRIVERARTQVGNLAHSLKTPLAVLLNEGRAIGAGKGRLIVEQASAMQQQVEHYLQRARIAAQRESVVFRTPVRPVMERMTRVVQKLGPDKQLSLSLPPADVTFAGETEDLEEITGNLLENAMKWSRGKVRLTIGDAPDGEGGSPHFTLAVEDDGPGIPEEKAREALQRGRRLDETKPGTGLGLAIVSDLVKEYNGRLELGRSDLGGLKATVTLRRTMS